MFVYHLYFVWYERFGGTLSWRIVQKIKKDFLILIFVAVFRDFLLIKIDLASSPPCAYMEHPSLIHRAIYRRDRVTTTQLNHRQCQWLALPHSTNAAFDKGARQGYARTQSHTKWRPIVKYFSLFCTLHYCSESRWSGALRERHRGRHEARLCECERAGNSCETRLLTRRHNRPNPESRFHSVCESARLLSFSLAFSSPPSTIHFAWPHTTSSCSSFFLDRARTFVGCKALWLSVSRAQISAPCCMSSYESRFFSLSYPPPLNIYTITGK